MKSRLVAVPAVYAFLGDKKGNILFARRANTGYQDGNWNVPSGHLEEGELPLQALIRETEEEVGVDISKSKILPVHTSYRPAHDPTGPRIDFFYFIDEWEGEVRNMEPNKCDALGWFNYDALPENMTPHVRHALDCMDKGIIYSELGVEWLKERGLYMLA